MHTTTDSPTPQPAGNTGNGRGGQTFQSSAGLRALLHRLHRAGPGAWEHDAEAAALMVFTAEKYAALARKHGLDSWEAASAAFDVMRSRSTREAADPWAVVTHAVRITCIAEERAQGLLCSVHQARRPHISVFHDPERFSDRETPLSEYHPAFHTTDHHPEDTHDAEDAAAGSVVTAARTAVEDAIELFTLLDWHPRTARAGIEHICSALTRASSRQAAYEALRRDKHARALLDIPGESWTAMLKALLGHPDAAYSATNAGRGVLLRLLIGESLPMLLRDEDLVVLLAFTAPGQPRTSRGQ